MLPATGSEGWGFLIMGAFVLVMVGAGIIGRKKDTHDKAN